jgi:DNA replication initiation complex subunit (GINS family)
MMSIEALSEQLSAEHDIESLDPLPTNFMNDAKQYLQQLKIEQNNTYDYREQAMIRDEEKSAVLLLEGIVDRRFAKLINLSLIHSLGNNTIDQNNLNGVDREAFDILHKAIKDAKSKIEL